MSIVDFVRRHRWPLGIAIAALAVRLVWNLWIHSPADYVYSDMRVYVQRAQMLVEDPLRPDPYQTFFPVGAHYLLAAVMALFGKESLLPASLLWAVLGAGVAPVAYYLAGRLHGGPAWSDRDDAGAGTLVARIAGAVVAVYYPLVSYTGYFLSENPYALCVTLAALLTLRVADGGRPRDAWWLGAALAAGTLIRSQLLAVLPLMALIALWRRQELPAFRRLPVIAGIALPLAAVLAFNLVASHHHTGRATLVSQNRALNRAFGRCHAAIIDTQTTFWGPPPLGELHRREQARSGAWPRLDPAIAPTLKVDVHMWDEPAIHELADRCVREAGWKRQLSYAVTHVVLLWGFSPAWPDMGQPAFRPLMQSSTRTHLFAFALPSLLALIMCFRRTRARQALVVAYPFSLLVVVVLYYGDARLRVPYDAVWIAIALDVYAVLLPSLAARWRRFRAR